MADFTLPITRYALSGDVNIAYQVMGDGPVDIVLVPSTVSHIEGLHELPGSTAFMRRLSSFARVIVFDLRGQGLSDRMTGAPSLEQRTDDIRAVMDATGSKCATLVGFSGGASMGMLFAATHPDRVSGLVLFGAMAVGAAQRDGLAIIEERISERMKHWGDGAFVKKAVSDNRPVSAEMMERFGRLERMCYSPGAIKTVVLLNSQIDVRPILGSIRVPSLVLHRRTDAVVPVEQGRALAKHIPGGPVHRVSGG